MVLKLLGQPQAGEKETIGDGHLRRGGGSHAQPNAEPTSQVFGFWKFGKKGTVGKLTKNRK